MGIDGALLHVRAVVNCTLPTPIHIANYKCKMLTYRIHPSKMCKTFCGHFMSTFKDIVYLDKNCPECLPLKNIQHLENSLDN